MLAVTLPLVRSNSWDAQLAIPNYPRYARLETNLGIGQAKEVRSHLLCNGTYTITLAVGAVCRCKAKTGLRRSPWGLHTRTRLSSLLRLNLDSSLKMTWFHSAAVQFSRAWHHSKRRRRWVGVKGSTRNGRRDPKCPSARRLHMVREDTGVPNEVLPVPEWRPMKQLAVHVHFLRCGGLLDDWSVEGVLSLVFV
ncbi:uncharacterized protein TNCV_3623331 [Trichonephila clavipes]|nr:uncharacterized protein TNCV_3623331 [Trichonephila clavipes]